MADVTINPNLGEMEQMLAKAARECSAEAVRRTFAAGLPRW